MKSFKEFIKESKMGRELASSIGSAGDRPKPKIFTTADFKEDNTFMVRKKGGIPVNFKVSDGTQEIQSLEDEKPKTVPKGHVIVHRHTIKGDKPYSMPPELFNNLHDDIDHKKGTATQKGVLKRAIKAHLLDDGPHGRHGIFHPDWSKTPMKVKHGDIIVDNGGGPNDVAAIDPDVFKKTYDLEKEKK